MASSFLGTWLCARGQCVIPASAGATVPRRSYNPLRTPCHSAGDLRRAGWTLLIVWSPGRLMDVAMAPTGLGVAPPGHAVVFSKSLIWTLMMSQRDCILFWKSSAGMGRGSVMPSCRSEHRPMQVRGHTCIQSRHVLRQQPGKQ